MATIKAEKFLGLTEWPLYQQPTGKLKVCQNLRVTPDGLLEAAGGTEKLMPSGGTATAPISGGFYTGAHEHAPPVCWIMRYTAAGATYSNNLALQAYIDYFPSTATGNRLYFIAPNKYSLITLLVGTAGTGAYTMLWKYLDTGGAAQTLTGVTEDFKTTGTRTISFSPPATWGANSVNNVYGYVIYAESATAVMGTIPQQKDQRIQVDWQGMKQLFLASSDGASSTSNGTVKFYGQNGTTANWTSVISNMTSGNDPRVRFASWRGYLYWLNGIEQKRYNLDSVADMGFATPTGAVTTSKPGGTGLTGLFHYAVTYGYGAAGELGESSFLQTTATVTPANELVRVTISGLTSVPAAGTVDVIYIYRSVDLSVVTLASSYAAFPFYRIASVTRGATGAFPASYDDSVMALPVPIKTMNPLTNLPPSKCQYIAVHRSRMFLASNPQYPGRAWWSKNFETESFNQDEDFADFTRQTGGVITGFIEFADQIVVFTEDAMYGIANVDMDPPNVYIISAGVGCVAPDSVRAGYGFLCWVARGGIYIWDGQTEPKRVSDDLPLSLVNLSLENHGGSRGVIYDRMYEVTFISQANAVTSISRMRYDLASDTWSTRALATSDVNLGGLLNFTAPFGHADAGVRHPLYGKVQASGTLYHVYVGDWTVTDDGNAVTCSAYVHFGPNDAKVINPKRVIAVYKPGGWATPTLQLTTSAYIGDAPVLGSGFVDGATDYSIIQAPITGMVSYSGDIVSSFTALSNTGTAKRQYLIAMYLDGNVTDQPPRTN